VGARQVHALGQFADPGRVDVDAVAVALLDDLRVAGDDAHAGLGGGGGHRTRGSVEVGDLESLLEHEAHGEVERLGARGGDVVDRAAHREPADVGAGKKSGLTT